MAASPKQLEYLRRLAHGQAVVLDDLRDFAVSTSASCVRAGLVGVCKIIRAGDDAERTAHVITNAGRTALAKAEARHG